MNKRKRFVAVSAVLTLGLAGIQLVSIGQRYEAIVLFSGLSILLSGWALFSDLSGIEWVTLLTLPALYPTSVALFYFLLPVHWLSQLTLLVLFGIGMYALLLTENIYSVAAIRTIQLLRAAQAVGFLVTVITAVFLIGTIFSFRLPFWVNGIGAALVLFPLLLQGIWSATLKRTLGPTIVRMSVIVAVLGGGIAAAIGFLPMAPLIGALLVSGYLYVGLGIVQHSLQDRLFSRTVLEYVLVGLVVLLAAFGVSYR